MIFINMSYVKNLMKIYEKINENINKNQHNFQKKY